MRKILVYVFTVLILSSVGFSSAKGVELIRFKLPEYPTDMRRFHVDGKVVVRVKVSPEGKVKSTEILESPAKQLSDSVLTAAKSWRFSESDSESSVVIPIPFDAGDGTEYAFSTYLRNPTKEVLPKKKYDGEGTFSEIRMLINADGSVKDELVVRTDSKRFSKEAMKLLKKWKFEASIPDNSGGPYRKITMNIFLVSVDESGMIAVQQLPGI